MVFYIIFITIVTSFIGVVTYIKWKLSYWKRKDVPYIEPDFLFGNTRKLLTRKSSFGEQFLELYKQGKARDLKWMGGYFMTKPFLLPLDLDVIKCILIKDFSHFMNHDIFIDEKKDPLAGHLLTLKDEKWRNLRGKLTPTFTSGKIKMMFSTIASCSPNLEKMLDGLTSQNKPIDIKEALLRYNTDVISLCAFGVESNCLQNANVEFFKYVQRILIPGTFLEKIRPLALLLLPRFVLRLIHLKAVKPDVEAFFRNVIKNVVEFREKNNVFRKDFIHLLIQLKNRGIVSNDNQLFNEEDKKKNIPLTLDEITAQAYVFFLAGFETSSITISFTLYELAVNRHIQAKVRKEIHDVLNKHGNKFTYDAIIQMTYMDQVINETLRLHSPIPTVTRVCNKEYKIPGSNFIIEEGIRIQIPACGIHMDADFYPNPEVFDPERFNTVNSLKRSAIAFLPFGEGPRKCIGVRFGLLQSKLAIVTILNKFDVSLKNKTKIPFISAKRTPFNWVEEGIWLNLSKIDL